MVNDLKCFQQNRSYKNFIHKNSPNRCNLPRFMIQFKRKILIPVAYVML